MINKLKNLRNTGSEEGFTLIELMIVVVIIGILAAIAIPIFMNQQKEAMVASVKSDIKNNITNIATALTKHPTAKVIYGNSGPDVPYQQSTGNEGWIRTAPINDPAPNLDTFEIVTTDGNIIMILGSWNSYNITGYNEQVAPRSQWGIIYQSSIGTYAEVGTR